MSPTLQRILDLQQIGVDRFSVPVIHGGDRIFGGHLLAQALMSAARTVEQDRQPNSIHASFLRAGVAGTDLTFEVQRIRDGGSFSTRRVVIHQQGRELLMATVSFHVGEAGEDWQPSRAESTMPRIADASPIPSDARFGSVGSYEIRTVAPWTAGQPREGLHPYWVRADSNLGESPALHYAALLLISDLGIIRAARNPHSQVPGNEWAAMSLDHALWWHRAPRADQWMLVEAEPTSNALGRGMAHGRIRAEDGTLLATLNQEVLLRMPARKPRAEQPAVAKAADR
ncbi:acyl-CoA thioesterase-2 [Antricoccus suffuscus]|uniref:Acyl-CoA thioesterase-2 n=2 Tax=Antricoccus suffuscus TaxID=1629062 RepID=A0A2T0ZFQ5_9ACTN|nr:acyl-CoA thioesterase-2 [Antricoccus suffuscus]